VGAEFPNWGLDASGSVPGGVSFLIAVSPGPFVVVSPSSSSSPSGEQILQEQLLGSLSGSVASQRR
jgi:hypothetical protein